VSPGRTEAAVRFSGLSPDFASPYGEGTARWANVLRLHSYANEESIAVVLPLDFANENVPRLRLGGRALISCDGIVLPQEYKDHPEYLSLLTGRQAIIAWLKQHDVEAEPSDAGRIAEQVLSAVGGFWGAYLFADEDTLKLLDAMAKSIRRHQDGKLEEYPDRAKPVTAWQKIIARRKNQQLSPQLGLDLFVKANILKLGLSVECPNCMKKNWCSLHDLDEQLTCDRCLKRFDFPQGSLNFRNTPWQYRVVGPFSIPDFAGGAYATVLALSVFAQHLGSQTQLSYSTNLDIALGQENLEVDFAFWYLRDYHLELDEEPVLAFGEAKSFASEAFEAKDIERMKKLAVKFPGSFQVFATLKDNLSDDERSAIGDFALWGRDPLRNGHPRAPVIVLTGVELFSEWLVDHTWKNLDDKRGKFAALSPTRLDNLWTLADLTQQFYLGLPDRFETLREKVRAVRSNAPEA
jgi:hypothetical protein